MIKVLIADDEKPARDRLKKMIESLENVELVAEAENGDQVLSMILINKIDLAILDINMPGTAIIDALPKIENPPMVIFQTAYSEYAVDAFGLDAVDYLLKPYGKDRLKKAIDKAILRTNDISSDKIPSQKKIEHLSVKMGGSIRLIAIEDVVRISFENGEIQIHDKNGNSSWGDNFLNYYEDLLSPMGFFRISRNELIKVSYISKLHAMFKGEYLAELKNGERYPVSRRRWSDLKKLLG